MQWTKSRPLERFVEIDIPPSENIQNVSQTAKGELNAVIILDLKRPSFNDTVNHHFIVFLEAKKQENEGVIA